jgi:ComF family protein
VGARDLFDELLDLVFPRRCVQCRVVGAWLCAACAAKLTPLPAERCPRCGAPGRWAPPGDAGGGPRPCPECGGRELAFSSAAAAFAYEGPARALVTACKFRSYRSLAREMSRLAGPAFLTACGGGTAGPALAVTWVPAHRTRTVERGFDQAELLARELAGAASLPAARLLRRTRETARQSGLHGAQRAANVADAFQLRQGADRVLTGLKRVVIVDDVYTTGETLNHCASVLAEAGVDPRVFSFARAVRRSSARTPISTSSAHREAPFHAKERSR